MSIDEEKGQGIVHKTPGEKDALDMDSSDKPDQGAAGPKQGGVLAQLRNLEASMDAKLGIESEAIVRKRAEDKKDVPWTEELTMALLWASGTMNTSCFATGFLGWQFGLSLKQAILITLFASILGGNRNWLLCDIRCRHGIATDECQQGWAAVSCITGGLALTAVSDGHVSLILGIIILAVVALLISFVGLNAILVYERYAWAVFFVIFLIIFGETGKYADNSTPASSTGATLSGAALSLIAIVYGSSAAWCTTASDYYVHYRADVSRTKVFLMTSFGIAIPTSIGMLAGCVVASSLNNQPEWRDTYERDGLGYLIQDVLYPRGFAKFLLTLLVLSGINTNVISIYSASLSFQQLARPLALIPRFVWTLVSFACILALAVGGREQLNTYLQNFLSLLGYWCTSYAIILLEEHYIFRKGKFENYDLEGWNDPARLPLGIGAAIAFGLGVVSWCMGMNQTWFVAPLAKAVGDNGGDVANELTFVVTALGYLPARYLELRMIGR
ncbi:hypothetical protein J3458_007215 [Metarhizium acridum]|uniref:uncharacterized protein n=1 Tax=Metarhizium acridum TaxID=92637 RepID=UPI001C6B08C3|nr:hypothetical protein J3458_007215 [Metarhizium acridum]